MTRTDIKELVLAKRGIWLRILRI